MKNIATYPSSNHAPFRGIFDHLSCQLTAVRTAKQVNRLDCDGILLQGGGDISPTYYGQTDTHSRHIDHDRDIVEWWLVRKALACHIPIMGICRGMQWLVIATGGSLYQDIAKQHITQVNHQSGTHWLTAVKWPIRAHLPSLKVNSRHHQATSQVLGLKVVAKSPDGLTEAVWKPGLLGVQWHPEDMITADPSWLGLFRWFLTGLQ